MKNWGQNGLLFCSAVLTAVAVFCVLSRIPSVSGQNAALAAAGFILPREAVQTFEDGFEEEQLPSAVSSAPQSSSAPISSTPPPSSSQSSSAPSGTVETVVAANVKEMSIANSGVQYQGIWVKNTNKKHTIDIEAELNKQPAVKIKKDGTPQVLIYHTHTTEAFSGVTRTQDNTKNVVTVGNEIEAQLRLAGIGVIHDITCHDYPSYNGSYDRSAVTIQRNLKAHPTIQVTLDIHRDAMGAQDGTRIKPTALITGKKAAQLMIISGCDDNGTLGYPNWEYNLRLAVRLQKAVANTYPGLARPLYFCNRKYNEHMTKGSLLLEIGTDASTLEEATYTGELFGKALVSVLNQLT